MSAPMRHPSSLEGHPDGVPARDKPLASTPLHPRNLHEKATEASDPTPPTTKRLTIRSQLAPRDTLPWVAESHVPGPNKFRQRPGQLSLHRKPALSQKALKVLGLSTSPAATEQTAALRAQTAGAAGASAKLRGYEGAAAEWVAYDIDRIVAPTVAREELENTLVNKLGIMK